MDSYKVNNFKPTSTNNSKPSNVSKIIYIVFIIILIFLVIYVLMCYYNYSTINCYEKKTFPCSRARFCKVFVAVAAPTVPGAIALGPRILVISGASMPFKR